MHLVTQQMATILLPRRNRQNKPPQTRHPPLLHPICRESKLNSPASIYDDGGQATVPGPQMPKGTCPNNPICCHASVHGGGGGGGVPTVIALPESASVVGTAQAGRGLGSNTCRRGLDVSWSGWANAVVTAGSVGLTRGCSSLELCIVGDGGARGRRILWIFSPDVKGVQGGCPPWLCRGGGGGGKEPEVPRFILQTTTY